MKYSNGRAYFLTAFHNLDNGGGIFGWENGILDPDEIAALANARFQFQFWRTACNGTVNNDAIQFSGAILRSSYQNTDMVLLELTDPPGIGDGVNYAGWSRQTNAPSNTSSFILHHPDAADMRVTSTRNVSHYLYNNFYWSAHYSSGTVTGGSSGSALFNEFNQVVGQLRSGWSSCNATTFGDRYGKFYHSWNNGGLQQWLSPSLGLQSKGSLNLTDIPINGPGTIACTTPAQFSTLPNLLDVTYQWTVTSGLQVVSGQGTSTATIAGITNNVSSLETITLILKSPTKGENRIYTTTKNVNLNGGSVIGYYNSPTNISEPLNPSLPREFIWNDACFTQTINTNMIIPHGSAVTWEDAGNSGGVTWWQNGYNLSFYFSDLNQYAYFRINVTNTCGTQSVLYRFRSVSDGCSGGQMMMLSISPNPSIGDTKISLIEKAKPDRKKDIQQIKIIDKVGMIKRQYSYGTGVNSPMINVSGLIPDIYTILAFDGKNWTASKLAVQ